MAADLVQGDEDRYQMRNGVPSARGLAHAPSPLRRASGSPVVILVGRGVLAIWHDIQAGAEAAFHGWHVREHLPERLAVPGFLRARRYEAIEGTPRFYNDYLTVTPEVLASPPYLARLDDPTPWTRQLMPSFRNINRSACTIRAAFGRGEGGVLATLRVAPRSQRPALLATLAAALEPIVHEQGIVAAQLWEADAGTSLVATREAALRAGPSEVADVVVALEGLAQEPVAAAAGRVAAALGDGAAVAAALYRLTYRLDGGC
jgi:hypothetical protein